ncbi:MAG: hypothetical protein V3U19_10390, partial [Thermodesulfobacteriota bacterium]
IYRAQMKVVKYLGFNRAFADSKGLCGANPKYLTTAEHGGIFLGDIARPPRLSPPQADDGGQAFQKQSLPINHQCLNI